MNLRTTDVKQEKVGKLTGKVRNAAEGETRVVHCVKDVSKDEMGLFWCQTR